MKFTKKCYKNIDDIIACIIIGLGISFLFTGKWLGSLDGDFNAYIWGVNFSEIAHALSNNEFFLWNPNIWGGISGIHNFTSPFYPIILLEAKLFYDSTTGLVSYYALLVHFFIHFLICAYGFYFLFRQVKINVVPSLCGVLLGMPILGLSYLQLCWIPVFLLFIFRSINSSQLLNQNVLFAGLAWGMLCLQQLAQGAVIGLLLIGMMWIVLIVMEIKRPSYNALYNIMKFTMHFLLSGLIGLGVAAIYLLPVLEQSADLLRVTSNGFSNASEGVSIFDFYAHTESIDGLRYILEGKEYILIIPILVIIGLFSDRKTDNKDKNSLMNYGKFLFVATIFMSTSIILENFLYYIPFINRLRETYLFSKCIFPFAIATLVAFGMESLSCLFMREKRVVYNYFIMILICFIYFLHSILPINATSKEILSAIVVAFFVLISLYIIHKKWDSRIIKGICFIMVIFLCGLNVYYVKEINYEKTYTTEEAAKRYQFISQKYKMVFSPGNENDHLYRVMTLGGINKFSSNAASNIGGGYYTEGYWEPIYHKTLEAHWNLELSKRMLMNNVKYFVVAESEDESYMDWLKIVLLNDKNVAFYDKVENVYPSYDALDSNTLLIYKNINYKGEGWMCYDLKYYNNSDSMENIFERINDKDFDPASEVLVKITDDKMLEYLRTIKRADNNANVSVIGYSNNTISLECTTAENGILLLAESDASGWKAYVDGKRVEILECNYFQKGLYIEAGKHLIKLRYEPKGFIIGSFVTCMTLIIIIIIFIILKIKGANKVNINRGSQYV